MDSGFGQAKVPFSSPLLKTHKPLPSKKEDLQPRAAPITKVKECPAFDFLLQYAAHQGRKSLKAFAHVSQASSATKTHRLPEKLNIPGSTRSP